jgi:hypothetical protein
MLIGRIDFKIINSLHLFQVGASPLKEEFLEALENWKQ